jgi:hypothetical protein
MLLLWLRLEKNRYVFLNESSSRRAACPRKPYPSFASLYWQAPRSARRSGIPRLARIRGSGASSRIVDRMKKGHAMNLEEVDASAWSSLEAATNDPQSGFRFVNLCSVDAAGRPQGRMVVLRRVDTAARLLEIHTDTRSPKWLELSQNPVATIVGFCPSTRGRPSSCPGQRTCRKGMEPAFRVDTKHLRGRSSGR